MDNDLYFFTIFLTTILITRIVLYSRVMPKSPSINGYTIHHYVYGLIICISGIVLQNVSMFAMGFALFIDELGFVLIGGKTFEENYSKLSLFLLSVFVVMTYIFRSQILFWK